MKISVVSFALLSFVVFAGCATSRTTREPSADRRDYAYKMSDAELRETAVFARSPETESHYETLHKAFVAGTAPTLDEVFPSCFDADGTTIRALPRQVSGYVEPKTSMETDGGHQYCRMEIEIAPGEIRAGQGQLFPPVPVAAEKWSGVFRLNVASAPFAISSTDKSHFRRGVKTLRLACKTEENTLVCTNLIDASIKKLYARKTTGQDGGPATYVLHLDAKGTAAANDPATAYLYMWDTVEEKAAD